MENNNLFDAYINTRSRTHLIALTLNHTANAKQYMHNSYKNVARIICRLVRRRKIYILNCK